VSRRLVLDDGRNQRELLLRERITVGRDPACDVSHPDPRLSRWHAEFTLTPQGVIVNDLESRNGVRVNGQLVREMLLSPGDLVEIAHLMVRFVEDVPSEPAGDARPSVAVRPVDEVEVKEGLEDDRTRIVAANAMSTTPSGPLDDGRQPPTSAADVAIAESARRRPPSIPVRLGVLDLLASAWGWRILAQGALLAVIVFLMTAVPVLNWYRTVTGSVPGSVLFRMLAAPLVASMLAGLLVASLIARTTARALGRNDRTRR
jgi:hypothetical protein